MDATVITRDRQTQAPARPRRPATPWLPAWLTSPVATYVMRTLLAVTLAFYLAFTFQLASPGSAAITVIIVANPARGAIISKGLWRIFGTITGAVASVVIVACYAQSSLLFLAAFCAWLGACVFVSSMFRYFRSYAAVLSGYTVAIIAFGALSNPDDILILAASRLAVVTIGVVASTIVTMIFQPGLTSETVLASGVGALRDTALLIKNHAIGMDDAAFQTERTRLAAAIERLDETVEFAGAESYDVSIHAASLRRGLAALYAALITTSIADTRAPASSRTPAWSSATVALLARADAMRDRIAALDEHDPASLLTTSQALERLLDDIAAVMDDARETIDVATLARLQQIIRQLHDCTATFAAWQANHAPRHQGVPLGSFKDFDMARRNALRTVIASMGAGLFWYYTAWTYGSLFLLFVGVVCALISSAPSAAAASVQFAKGATLATLVAPICGFAILPHVSGFPLLIAAILPFLAVGIHATTNPKYALSGLAFCIFFLVNIAITNHMAYDFETYLNSGMAIVAGAGTGALVFRVLIPPNPARDARKLIAGIRQAIERVTNLRAKPRFPNDPLAWQVFVNQRLQRLFLRLTFDPAIRTEAIGAAGALLIIVQQILGLRDDLPPETLPPAAAAAVARALHSLGNLRDATTARTDALAACQALSAPQETTPAHTAAMRRLAARFRVIAAQLPEAAHLLALETSLGSTA